MTPATRRELSQVINNHSIPTLISQAPGPSQKRSRSPSSPSYPDATTFSDGKPASETPKLNPEDVMTRLEDIEVEIDTLRADTEDKELLISELQDSLAAAENEIALLQIRGMEIGKLFTSGKYGNLKDQIKKGPSYHVSDERKRRGLSQVINNHSVPTLILQAPGPSRKRSRSPSSLSHPDATTFSDSKPASESSELNPEDVTARLEDIEVEIDTLRADTEDKELLISELQDSLAVAENEISILQIRADDAENRRAEDHEQIQKILARLGL
ncbi:hypothetical protein Tco_0276528 [Tanacetum coccineum]